MLRISQENITSYELEKKLYTLQTLHTPRSGRTLARWLMGIGAVFVIVLFLPWQQNIQGSGAITALTPQDRPQTVETAIAGRIEKWRVQEGEFVRRGDTLLVLSEVKDEYFDPELLDRLLEQVAAKEDVIAATKIKIAALDGTILALHEGLQFKLQQASNKLQQSKIKLVSDSTDLIAEKINNQIALRQFSGGENMYRNGLVSLTEYEKRKLKLQETAAKVISSQNKVALAGQEIINARLELNTISAEYAKEITKAQSDRSSAVAYLADAEGELSKLKNKYASVQVRTQNRALTAPQDGFVVKALKAGIGETVKEGEALVTVQPSQPQKAVEMYVRAMDVPLLSVGRRVRLEFDGWPALQFAGWPSVAVGTFGGKIAVIDYVNSKEGKYRILVTPDQAEESWPAQLRIGSGVYGWAMLSDVPIWYELWRQLNGFPPSLNQQTPGVEEGVAKK